jgi:glucose/arabinose dehydrogenase
VAVDYMTGLGTEIVRRDEIRLLEDTTGDGYADLAHVVADGFQSIEGLTRRGDTLFVMHSPYLTSVRRLAGGGVERRDLLVGLGLPPEENPVRLHCANGITAGHDGWLYLALGDHGCNVVRAEGDRLILKGGGILRCRPDGRDLHVFARGLRNIYDGGTYGASQRPTDEFWHTTDCSRILRSPSHSREFPKVDPPPKAVDIEARRGH